MKKNKKKLMQLSSALCMGTMLLAGCATASSSSGNDGQTSAVSGSETSASEKPVEFSATYVMTDWGLKADDYPLLNDMQEMANVKINWMNYSGTDYSTQKNLLLSGTNIPEVLVNSNTPAEISKYAQQGMVLDLTDLIPQYMPNLDAAMKKYPSLAAKMKDSETGKIYALPNYVGSLVNRSQMIMYINQTWLDNLGLEMPETTDELFDVLMAFKEQDANQNGDSDDEIPFDAWGNLTSPKEPYGYGNLFGAFGAPDSVGGRTVINHFVKDRKTNDVTFVPETEGYKKAIEYMNKLYENGLWDPESFTFTQLSAYTAKVLSNPSSVGVCYHWQIVEGTTSDEYVPLPPLKGPDGEQNWLYNSQVDSDLGKMSGQYTTITVKAKGKEEAILRFFDLCYDPDIAIQLNFGYDGTNIVKDSDGNYKFSDTLPEGVTRDENRYKTAPVWFPSGIEAQYLETKCPVSDDNKLRDSQLKEYFDKYMEKYTNLADLVPTSVEQDVLNSKGADISQYVEQMQVHWITEGGIESDWDSYLENLKKLGLDEYKETVAGMSARTDVK